MILLHSIKGEEILVSINRIYYVEQTGEGSRIEYSDYKGSSTIRVKELPCQILLKINQSK